MTAACVTGTESAKAATTAVKPRRRQTDIIDSPCIFVDLPILGAAYGGRQWQIAHINPGIAGISPLTR
jgi:hypothetical protein